MQNKFNLHINLSDLPDKTCACGCTAFVPLLKIKFLSRIQNPYGKDQYMLLNGGIACSKCGTEINLNPEDEISIFINSLGSANFKEYKSVRKPRK